HCGGRRLRVYAAAARQRHRPLPPDRAAHSGAPPRAKGRGEAEPAARRPVPLPHGRYPRRRALPRRPGRPRVGRGDATEVTSFGEQIMADATTATPEMMNPAMASERIPPKRLFAFLIMVFGMFMAILDIQVVSASLAEIQAGLSASQSEVSWVQTSYL